MKPAVIALIFVILQARDEGKSVAGVVRALIVENYSTTQS